MTEELKNIPDDLEITDVFLHVEPIDVARDHKLRRRLIEYYREERQKFMEDGKRAKKLKTDKSKKESKIDEPI